MQCFQWKLILVVEQTSEFDRNGIINQDEVEFSQSIFNEISTGNLTTTNGTQLMVEIGIIPGCPMPGEPVDPGILSIPGFLGSSRDVPCQGSLWILEYLVSRDVPC